MTTDFLAVRPEATAEEAIGALREARDGEFRSYVYVTDEDNRLVGVVPLYRLVLVDPATRIADFIVRDPVRVRGTDDQEEVARVFRERRSWPCRWWTSRVASSAWSQGTTSPT